MMAQPKISVLVPVFNGEKYLAECLDSILMQDFLDYELLISDNGSTDGTMALVENYAAKDPHIRWWRNPTNLGPAANFNCCLRAARGEYIKYVFADDKLLTPSALRQMVQVLAADPTIALVGSASHFIDAHGRVIQVRDFFRGSSRLVGLELFAKCLEQPVNLIGEPSVVMFRREAAARGFDERFRQLVDLEFWFHLLEQGDFAYIAGPLSAFRRHPAQETETNRRSGVSRRDEILLKKIYYPKILERQMATRLMLFNQIRQLQKCADESAVDLKAKLMQVLGKGWYVFYALRYRGWRLFQDLQFWRSRWQLVDEALPEQGHPAPARPARSGHPLVSVLVPVFNGEKYLAECLDSVLMQDFPDYELLISEDCSRDGTVAVIERYAAKDPRIRWWRNPVNLGPVANLNFCLRQARGEFIKFVFADDKLLTPSALRQMVQVMAADPTIALVGSASHVITAGGRVIQVRDFFRDARRQPGMKLLAQHLEQSVNLISEPTTVMFRREQAARGFDERFRRLPDLELWFHLLEQGDFAYVAEPLSAFRRHPAQETEVIRRSGGYAHEDIFLKKIYYPKAWERRAVSRRMLFNQIRRLRKSHDEPSVDLKAKLMQTLGKGWFIYFAIRYRWWRLFQDLKFWKNWWQPADGEPLPQQWLPAPTVSGRSDHPLVSVLVPVYNGEKYLAACLDSILAQDFTEMEILIADDGSTDGSRELIQRYAEKDRRIRWWRNPTNLGLAGNFNCCLRAARNDYIKYVLQDDLLLAPSAIRQMVQALDADPAVSLVGSASHVIDDQSHRLEVRNNFRRSGVMDGKGAIMHCLSRNGNLIGEPSVVMFRREQAARGFDERYRQLIDLDLWFHLLEQGRFAYLAEPLCAFRQHFEQQTAVNRQLGAHVQDELLLAQFWLSRPWLRAAAGRRVLFKQIYNLRKHHGRRARPFIGDIMASLTMKWYALYWLEHKISSPFSNLKRSLRKRFAARSRPPATAKARSERGQLASHFWHSK
jgi:glycosyltransferase involved in cell wall biosynthesis